MPHRPRASAYDALDAYLRGRPSAGEVLKEKNWSGGQQRHIEDFFARLPSEEKYLEAIDEGVSLTEQEAERVEQEMDLTPEELDRVEDFIS